MKTKRTSLQFSVTALIAAALLCSPPSRAFQIDFVLTFVPAGNIIHTGKPIHEEITRQGLTNITPALRPGVILNLQHGVQNSDVIHMFDEESHFDNCSVFLNRGFSNAFMTMTQRIHAARRDAFNNPQFLQPDYTNYIDIAAAVAATLGAMAVDSECLREPACPTLQAGVDAVLVAGFLPALAINPNPDPHRPTNPRSLFRFPPDPTCGGGLGLCGYLGPIQEGYVQILDKVEDVVDDALGNHFDPLCACDRNLEQVLGADNSYVVRLKRLKQAIRAYHAFQNLGHALHAAQDFFAHTDYVELMAGVTVGQPIAPGTVIPLPTNFALFNLAGLRTIMGDARFAQLESGDVFTIWLNEGDYSLGNAGIFNPFNPGTSFEIGGVDLFGLHLPPVTVPALGNNPNPFPGFNHGHYLSSTALGLNKDCPFDPAVTPTDEPAHRNFPAARQAAVQISALLWKSFLESTGSISAPVQIMCPTNRTLNTAPGQCSAPRSLAGIAIASGGCGPLVMTNNAPAQLPKGTNIIRWTASDECGNTAICNQRVIVMDRENPRIVCPTNRIVNATNSAGTVVAYPAPRVTDNCPEATVGCTPPSGFHFPIGTNTVRCVARDAAGNEAVCSFIVRVKGAAEQIRDQVVRLNNSALPEGTQNSLIAKLRAALNALAVGDQVTACATLQSFLNAVDAQSGKKIPGPQAAALTSAARQIRTVLNCRAP